MYLQILDLLQEARDEYELCIKKPTEYQKKVDSISDMFHLRGKNRLKGDNCPAYFVGKFEEASIIMFGLNPGYSSTNNPREEHEARQSWHQYQNLYINFFQFFARYEFQSPYYSALGYLLSGLLKTEYSNDGKWRLFDKYLANIQLIPYHSEGILLPSDFSSYQLAYLTERYRVGLEFIRKYNPKLIIFNGNSWRSLLVKHNMVQVDEKIRITQKFNMYFFKLYNIPCVLFDKFFQRIKKDSYHWYKTMREGQYEYIHEFKERIDEILWLQRKHHDIIDNNQQNPSVQQTSLAELLIYNRV